MPHYGRITGTHQGVEGSWFIELDDDGSPVSEFEFIPIEAMPDIVPVWSIELPLGDDEPGITFSDDETANLALIEMLRSIAELKGGMEETKGQERHRPSPGPEQRHQLTDD